MFVYNMLPMISPSTVVLLLEQKEKWPKVLILAAMRCLKSSQNGIIKVSLFVKFQENVVLKYGMFIIRTINR